MERQPRMVEMKARGVGMQVLKVDENWVRNQLVGVQWGGRSGVSMVDCVCVHVVEGKSIDAVSAVRV